MKLSREVKTGIIVVVAIALFIYGYNFLKGRDLFSTSTDLYARYDRIEGMTVNSAVWLNGYKIGQVREITLDPKTNQLLVRITISNDDARIPKMAIAKIASDGLLGSKVVQIVMPEGLKREQLSEKDYAVDGDILTGSVDQGLQQVVTAELKPLREKVNSLISSIDSVVTIVQVVLNKDAREDLVASFESIKNALGVFETTALRLDTLVASEKNKLSDIFTKVQSITTNLANNNQHLSNVIANFDAISDSVRQANVANTIRSTNKALADVAIIIDKINKGQGTMGMLINNDTLASNLKTASESLTNLTTDLQRFPGRYIPFNRKQRPPSLSGAEKRKQNQLDLEYEQLRLRLKELEVERMRKQVKAQGG